MNFKKYKDYSNTYVFDTGIKWPTITILWWIHWDEIVWINVIDTIVKQIKNNEINLLKWKLILAYWNEEAISKWVRWVDYNMNRIFLEKYIKDFKYNWLEVLRMRKIVEILDETDVLLDIHSTSSKSVPFMFAEDLKNELEVAKNTWIKKIIFWWENNDSDQIRWDTNSYVHKQWAIAFTLECWQHKSKEAFSIWYDVLVNILMYYGFILDKNKEKKEVDLVEMYWVEITKYWKFKFMDWIENFSNIKVWDLIWFDWNNKIIAKENFIILLPKYIDTNPWDEIFYYWKKIYN